MSGGARQITVTFAGEDRGLKKELKEAAGAADDLSGSLKKVDATQAHGQMDGLTGKAGGLKGALGGLKDSVGGELTQAFGGLTSKLGPAGGALEGLASSGASVVPVVGAVAAGLGAAAGIAKVTIGAYVDLADKVRDFKAVSGASTEDSSRFVAVLDDLGISSEAGAKAIAALTKNADSSAFAKMGIDVVKTNTGATDMIGTFQKVLEKTQGISDPIERSNVLTAAFGKSWQGILPLVGKSADEFERMLKANEGSGQILHDKDLKDAAAFKATMDQLGDVWQKFVLETGKFAMPIIKIIVEDISKFGEGVDKAGEFIGGLIHKFGPLEAVAKGAAAMFLALPLSLHALINISFEKVQHGLQSMIDVADKIAGPFVNFPDDVFHNKQGKVAAAVGNSADALQKMVDKAKAGTAATVELGDTAEQAAEKQKALDKALGELETTTGKQLAALEKMPASHKAVTDAAAALAAAHTAEKAASEASGAQAKTAAQDRYAEAQAAREHEAAVRAVSDAKTAEAQVAKTSAADVRAAEQGVADVRAAQPKLADDVTKAQHDLADAHRDAAQASSEEEAAQRRYQQVTGQLPPDIREVTKAQEAQLAVQERLAGLSDDLVTAQQHLADAQNELADAQKNLPAEAQEAMATARLKVTDATDRQAAAEAKLAADRAAGKPAADIVKDERDVEQAKISTAQATREQERANREWGDTSDELAEKTIAVHEAERNLARVKRDQTDATKDQEAATKTLTEVQQGAAAGSDRERAAKEKLTEAHRKSTDARDAEREASRKLEDAQKALAELPAKIAEAIGKLRDVEVKGSADRKDAHDAVTKAVDDQRLAGLKAAADAEKAEGQKQAAIAKTKTTADDYTTKALALVDAEVAARENAAQRAGKNLDAIGEANARLNALEATRRQALYDGHTKTVAELDAQITSIQNLRAEHDTATAKLKTNAGDQVTAVKGVSTALDDAAKPRTGSIGVDKTAADTAITAVTGRLSSEIVKTHTATLDADNSKGMTAVTNVKTHVDTNWSGKNFDATMGIGNEQAAKGQVTNVKTHMDTNWSGKNFDATMGIGNEQTAKGQVTNVKTHMDTSWAGNLFNAQMGVSNEQTAKDQVSNVKTHTDTNWTGKDFSASLTAKDGLDSANTNSPFGQVKAKILEVAKEHSGTIKFAGAADSTLTTLQANVKTWGAVSIPNWIQGYASQYSAFLRAVAAAGPNGQLQFRYTGEEFPELKLASGGLVPGAGDGDTVPAMLTPGEFVLRRAAVQSLGLDALRSLNRGTSNGAIPTADEIGAAVARALMAAGAARPVVFQYSGTGPERVDPRSRLRQVELAAGLA